MDTFARAAPAVLYPTGPSRHLARLLVGVALLGAAAQLAWWLGAGQAASPARWAVAGALWLAGALGALHFWRRQFSGALRWDGQAWSLVQPPPGDDAALPLDGAPQVFLDLQSHLWVQVRRRGARGSDWLWLAQRAQPERWLDLRRAVYSRAKPGVDPDASAPAGSRGA